MGYRELSFRARAKAARRAKRAQLDLLRRLHGDDLFVDHDWIQLLYTGDSDGQEIEYHLHAARWHEKDMHVFRSLLAPGQTAIDVGANIGLITTMLASLVGNEGRVLSFEPSPIVFAKLQKTIAANGLNQVIPLNLGCGAVSSVERLNRVSGSSGNASIVGSGSNPLEIRIEPLDEIPEVWATPVSLIKIDTEGYEPQVLQGAERLIAKQRPIIYLEMGGDYVESTHRSIEFLKRAGYGIDHVRSLNWASVGNGSDYFFLPSR